MNMQEMEEIIKLPLDLILLEWNYTHDRAKSSKNSIKLKNANDDSLIITRNSKGHYLYWNPKVEDDRGNIFNFCKNRGIGVKDLLESKDLEKLKAPNAHTLIPNNFKKATLESVEKYKEIKELGEQNFLHDERGISMLILSLFKTQIKQDNRGNICIPTYQYSTINDKVYYPQIGYVSYLKKQITKDKEGKPYDKPLKQLCYGAKGLEILRAGEGKIKNILLCESSIDSLSLFEIKEIKEPTLLCATNGIFTQAHKEILESFEKKDNSFENPKVILGFDKDEIGEKNANKARECFKKFEVEIVTPFLKDFNDDLIARKLLESRDYKKEEELSKEVMNLTLEVCNHQLESYNAIESKLDNKSKKDLQKEMLQYVGRIDFLLKKALMHLDEPLRKNTQKSLEKFLESLQKEQVKEKNKIQSTNKGISR